LNTRANNSQEGKVTAAANASSERPEGSSAEFQLEDNRPQAIAQRNLQALADGSEATRQLARIQTSADAFSNRKPVLNPVHTPPNPPIQRRLKEKDIPKFQGFVRDNLPTLPGNVVETIIQEETVYGQACKAAKVAATEIEKKTLASASRATRSLTQELFDAYPPQAHHYILLGNSPALLENAIKQGKGLYSHLPLGGLTDLPTQTKTFGGGLEVGTERTRYGDYYDKSRKLQTYLKSFLENIKFPNLVVIDFTQSGVSAIVAADLLAKASNELGLSKTVKLFTFSKALPTEGNALLTQTDYDLVAEAPEGDDERTFVTLTDTKAYKEQIGLTVYRSLKLHELELMEDPRYEAVTKELYDPKGAKELSRI